MYLKTQKSIIR